MVADLQLLNGENHHACMGALPKWSSIVLQLYMRYIYNIYSWPIVQKSKKNIVCQYVE